MIKRSHRKFFSSLSYSFGNEDWKVERKALKIQPADSVVCITSSGDRPFHLLLDPCKEIISIDLNPIQNSLARLKAAAMESFDYHGYLGFLGALPNNERKQQLKTLYPQLSVADRTIWDENQHLIEKGVLYQGAVERICSKSALFFKTIRGTKIKKLFAFDDIELQQKFLADEWHHPLWKKTFCLIVNSPLFRLLSRDPGLFDNISNAIDPGTYIYDRFLHSMHTRLAKKNPLLSLVFRGYVHEDAFPPYLSLEGTNVIKKQLSQVRWETTNMIDFLENSPPKSYDCFSLSDIASYMDAQSFRRLVHAVYRTAKPNARFSIRQFMSDHTIPKEILPHFKRNPELENQLEKEESCCMYRLMVGTITN